MPDVGSYEQYSKLPTEAKHAICENLRPQTTLYSYEKKYTPLQRIGLFFKAFAELLTFSKKVGETWSKVRSGSSQKEVSLSNKFVKHMYRELTDQQKKGIDYYQKKAFEKAETCFKKLIQLDPQDHLSLATLCAIYSDQGKDDEAVKICKRVLSSKLENSSLRKLTPKDAIFLSRLGIIYSRQELDSKARKAYEKALKLDADNVDAREFLKMK